MDSPEIPEGKLVTCKLLENGIYELTFKDLLRTAIDEYFDYLAWIFEGKDPGGPTIRMLTDATNVKGLPLIYTVQRAKAFMDAHPNRPQNRMATLSNERILTDLIGNMIGLLQIDARHNAARYFRGRERERAIAWLLEDK